MALATTVKVRLTGIRRVLRTGGYVLLLRSLGINVRNKQRYFGQEISSSGKLQSRIA